MRRGQIRRPRSRQGRRTAPPGPTGRVRCAVGGVGYVLALWPEVLRIDAVAPCPVVTALRPHLSVVLGALAGRVLVDPRTSHRGRFLAACRVAVPLALLALRGQTRRPHATGDTLTIFSLNTHKGTAVVHDVARVVDATTPDIVVLIESGEPYARAVWSALATRDYACVFAQPPLLHSPQLSTRDQTGMTVLVRCTLGDVDVELVPIITSARWIEIRGGGLGRGRVLACHLVSPRPDRRGHTARWRRELSALEGWVRSRSGPRVVVGDLNSTLDHRPLRRLCRHGVDVAASTGRGLRSTWPAFLPEWLGLRIDHVLVFGGPVPRSSSTVRIAGTDHRGIVATISFDRRLPAKTTVRRAETPPRQLFDPRPEPLPDVR